MISTGTGDFNYIEAAGAIRAGAGIPAGQDVGPRVTPGLVKSALLTDVDGPATTLANSAAVATYIASIGANGSGSGTEADPYLIKNARFDNSESRTRAFEFVSSDAYFVRFYNCWFSGYDITSIRPGSSNNTIIIDNCLFTYDDTTGDPADTATSMIQTNGGDATVNINASLCNQSGRAFVRTLGAYTGTITLTDCRMTDAVAFTGATTSLVEQSGTGSDTVKIYYCEVDNTVNDSIQYGLVVTAAHTSAATFEVIGSIFNHVGDGTIGASVGLLANATRAHTGVVNYNRFIDPNKDSISAVTCDGLTIAYNDFRDAAANHRHVLMNGTAGYTLDNIQVNNNKAAASSGANAECFYFLETLGVVCEYNWVTQCSDDAYEVVQPQPGCIIRHNVGDNVTGQVVDVFEERGVNPGSVLVHHIYGDSVDVGVALDDRTSGDTVVGIFIDTTAGAKGIIELRNTGTAPANISIMSPMGPATLAGSGTVVTTSGVIGANNHINGVAIT